jgi:hypothetical protein
MDSEAGIDQAKFVFQTMRDPTMRHLAIRTLQPESRRPDD